MKKPNWTRQCIDMALERTGTMLNARRWAKELGIVRRDTQQSPETIKLHLVEYLARTPAKYISPTRFRETFWYWDPGVRYRTEVDRKLDRARERVERTSGEPSRIGDILGGVMPAEDGP